MLINQFTVFPCAHKAPHLKQFLKKAEYGPDFLGFQEIDMREGDHV
jgi:hypothetical protein